MEVSGGKFKKVDYHEIMVGECFENWIKNSTNL